MRLPLLACLRGSLCVFSITLGRFFSHAEEFYLSRWGGFSLTENTEATEVLSARFRAHRRPPAYRVHRALLLKKGVG